MKKNILTLLSLLLISVVSVNAQEILMQSGADTIVCGSTYTFKDAGGDNNYPNSVDNQQFVLFSSASEAELKVSFTSFQTELNHDTLFVYNGNGTTGTLLGAFSGDGLTIPPIYSNGTGCLTFVFNSDSVNNLLGWEATVNCQYECQEYSVSAQFNGVEYNEEFEICTSESFELSAIGDYPNSGVNYDQSQDNTLFSWDFGNGTSEEGQSVTKTYDEPGVYSIVLTANDVNGCVVTDTFSVKVMCGSDVDCPDCPDILMHPGIDTIVCGGTYTFKDAGGDNNYPTFVINQTLTIYSSEPGMEVNVIFNSFQTEANNDLLKIYNGPTANAANLIGSYSDNQLQGQSISSQGTGCLTFRFYSNYSVTAAGWDATVSCSYACQEYSVIASMNGTPLENGMDICMFDEVNFSAVTDYPNSGTSYEQNDANTTFTWVLGNGDIENEQSFTYAYDDNNTYGLGLFVTDANGCQNMQAFALDVLCGGDCPVCTDYVPSDSLVNTCTGTFFDSGQFNNYSNNESETVTFCPDEDGNTISMFFEEFDTEMSDKLYIYNGNDVESSPLITGLGSSTDDYYNVNDLQGVTVTSTNANGCLSFKWISDETGTKSGWYADISCEEKNCQEIVATPTFNGLPMTGNLSNTCINTDINISLDVSFPENNVFYAQSIENCQIEWDFGNGQTATGTDVSFFYETQGAKTISLYITDENNCMSVYTYTAFAACGGACPECPNPDGSECGESIPFCTDEEYDFPLQVNNGSAEEGPHYGCLYSQPNPVWYFLKIDEPGSINIHIVGNGGNNDVDFIAWGPFEEGTCDPADLSEDNQVDCSYTAFATEDCFIPNAQTGEVYTLLLTNYSNDAGNIEFQQTSGTGSTDCSIVEPCFVSYLTGTPDECASEDNTFSISGSMTLFSQPTVGTMSVCDDISGICTVYEAPFPEEAFFQLDNIPADGLQHMITVSFDSLTTCTGLLPYTATAPRIESEFEATPTSCFNACDGSIEQTVISGGLSPLSYAWSGTDQTTDTITGLCVGNYTVTVSDASNCSITRTITVEQPTALVVASSGSVDNLCFNGNGGQVWVNITGGTPDYQYQWSPAEVNANTNSLENLPDGNYEVTVTDANGCSLTKSFTVHGPSVPLAIQQIIPTHSNCFQANDAKLTIQIIGGTAPYMYQWELAGGETTTIQNPMNLQAGTHYVTVTDINNCVVTGEQITEEPTLLNVTYGTAEPSCFGYNDGKAWLITSGATPPYEYEWNNGWTDSTMVQASVGSYTVTVTDSKGCEKIVSNIQVTQPAPVVMDIHPISPICIGDTASLTLSVTSSPFSPYTYYWNGAISEESIDVSPLITTDYVAKVIDAHGCESADLIQTVEVYKPIEAFAELSRTTVCKGAPVTVNVNVQGGSPNTQFYLSDGTVVSDSFIVQPSETMEYMLIVDDDCNTPPDSVRFSIKVEEPPIPSFHADIKKGCVPLSVNFIQDVTEHEDGTQYLWTFENKLEEEDDDISTMSSPSYVFTEDGKFDVSLEVTDPLGCKSAKVRLDYIETYPIPTASFTATPTTVTTADPIVHFDNLSEGTDNCLWYFGDGDSTFAWNITHRYPTEKKNYTVDLFVYSAYGCSDSYSVNVSVLDEITFYLPTAFSPNNDAVNDVFKPSFNAVKSEGYSMTVFDRWGMKIFVTEDISTGWDGRYKDQFVQPGAYNYIIKYLDSDNVAHEKSGVINVIR